MKVRIKFGKKGYMKFIGHLDIMRFFQKLNRRAGIDISYSEGFSPHQKISFAAPLGVGLQSTGEYVDMEVNSLMPSAEAVKRLNDECVEGIEIYSFKQLPEDSGNAMSIVAAADYIVTFKYNNLFSLRRLSEIVNNFYNQDTIEVLKKTKKSEKTTDIKPLIYSIDATNEVENTVSDDDVSEYGIKMQLATGSVNNLKPELVMDALFAFAGYDSVDFPINIYRTEVYANKGTEEEPDFISLDDLGNDII
ncbi:MAG: DUF2344 domain-containing protein [Lachnospiraceae bacterium]|nr:DUF2344 domain-containing protein [Lachnospiraceae bacterium]